MKNYKLTIGWLYPELMNTYGDRGNIIALQKHCEWREIGIEIKHLNLHFNPNQLNQCDLLFMGGAQDKQQQIVADDLIQKRNDLTQAIEKGVPGLYVCGAYQFLGKYYKEADGTIIKGLNILDVYTENPGKNFQRLIGNIAIKFQKNIIVGFENHGGRTYLGKNIKPFGKVLVGYGNNDKEKTEGAVYKNTFGTYLHGPILPKNPYLADVLIRLALEKKYETPINLISLDDSMEQKAHQVIANRLGVRYNG